MGHSGSVSTHLPLSTDSLSRGSGVNPKQSQVPEAVKSKTYSFRQLTPRFLALTSKYKKQFAFGFLFLVLGSAINLSLPLIFKFFLNHENGTLLSQNKVLVALGLTLLFAVQGVVFYFRHYIFHEIGARVVADIRKQLFSSILSQDVGFFETQKTGDLMSRLSSDTEILQSAITSNISVVARYSLQVLGGLVFMLLISPKLTLLLALVIPVVVLGGMIWGKRLKKLARQMQEKLGWASSQAEETLTAIRMISVYGGRKRREEVYSQAIEEATETSIARSKFAAVFSSGMVFILHTSLAIILMLGAGMVISGDIGLADLSAFLLYGLIVAVSFMFLAGCWDSFTMAAGAGERIFSIIDSMPNIKAPDKPEGLSPHEAASVEFKNVTFSYSSRPDIKVLNNISFEIRPGETVALVGPSGAGKTTISSLIPRFYDPVSGEIFYQEHNVKSLSPLDLRSNISFVQQDPQVFSISIEDNIRYAKPDASRAQVEQACKVANLSELIEKLPEGLDTLVGERGTKLSGGEKQRLAIARAVLKNPALLILDEATSSLDSENESLVQAALDELIQERSCLVIAHRLSTVQHADKVLVLKDGEIVQAGDHKSLLNEEGLYKSLVNYQLL